MKRLLGLSLGALFVLAACGAGPPPAESTTTSSTVPALASPDPADPGAGLAAARERWAANGGDAYRYRFTDVCGECDPALRAPFDVAVYEGRLLPGDPRGLEIGDLFGRIDRAIADGDTVIVTYDETTGVPTEVMINPEDFAVDGGTHYRVEEFELGPPGTPISNEAVDAALALWAERGLVAYEYDVEIVCDCEEAGAYRMRITPFDETITVLDGGTGSASAQPLDQLVEDLRGFEEFAASDLGFTADALFRVDPALGHLTWLWVDVQSTADDAAVEALEMVAVVSNVTPIEDVPELPDGEQFDAYVAARRHWESKNFTRYTFELTVNCFCPEEFRGPFEITVEDGVITAASRLGEPVGEEVGLMTIDEIFHAVGGSIEAGVRIDVVYDRVTGVPTRADLDLDAIAVDGGLSLSVAEFRPLADAAALAELAAMRERWQATGPSDYTLTYEVFCECDGGAITITVKDGDFFDTSVKQRDGTLASAPPEFRYTVDTLHELIDAALTKAAFSVTAIYDERSGAPEQISIDWDGATVDDEIVIFDILVEPTD